MVVWRGRRADVRGRCGQRVGGLGGAASGLFVCECVCGVGVWVRARRYAAGRVIHVVAWCAEV